MTLSQIPRPRLIALVALLALPACHGLRQRDAAPAPAASIGNAEAAGLALVANNVEIGYALLAPDRALDPDVRAFAARMRTDHASLNAALTELLGRIDLPARDDPAGLALRDSSAARRLRLRAMSGHAFDVAYVDQAVRSHQELLGVIDRLLTPAATRRELRDYVITLRPVISAHLAHAEQLRATLAARRE